MRKILFMLLTGLSLSQYTQAQNVQIKVIQTSDVHGSFFPYDFINRRDRKGSLARVSSYVNAMRKKYGKNVILLDNGDILQGQPTCYYCNFVKPSRPNLAASVVNYLKYDAQTVGNHDIETGHPVYTIMKRDGVKVAVLGMLTPAIPNWLKESLWTGLRFDNMVTSAKYWMKHIQTKEKPDVIIGLFHSGREGGIHTPEYDEDASLTIAREVEGFDIILFGHDHTRYSGWVKNKAGKEVLCLDPSCDAYMVSDATINIRKAKGKVVGKKITGDVIDITDQPIDEKYMQHFKADIDSVNAFVNRKIGRFENAIYTRDCYFGSAAFTDFIHDLQLKITGADISFNAPLSFDARINKGDVYVSDMFNLYKYENQIYVLKMTGKEIRNHLEMSYDLWVNTMKSPDDHIMQISEWAKQDRQRFGFKNLAFNFDSAAGIIYEVDVTKPDGQKVRILSMADGTPFDENRWYKVAMNSYRGNGGGELLTKGAGIPRAELKSRIAFESEKDQRFYLMNEIEKAGVMNPQAHNNWKFVPEAWTKPAIERDRKLIFGN